MHCPTSTREPDRARLAAVVGCAALLAYASIKAAWGLGSTVGVVDPVTWESDLEQLTPWQRFVALWGTVLLDVAAGATLVMFSRPPSDRRVALRSILRRLAVIGAIVMGGVGLVGLAGTLGPALGVGSRGSEPLAAWVFVVVYGSFTVAAASFAVVLREDRARSRRQLRNRGDVTVDRCPS